MKPAVTQAANIALLPPFEDVMAQPLDFLPGGALPVGAALGAEALGATLGAMSGGDALGAGACPPPRLRPISGTSSRTNEASLMTPRGA
jgi:hypothetical protein